MKVGKHIRTPDKDRASVWKMYDSGAVTLLILDKLHGLQGAGFFGVTTLARAGNYSTIFFRRKI